MKLTYREVLDRVCQCANYLKSIGVKKGDDVSIYMPMVVELPIAMLACARIGAVHSVIFGGFSAESVAGRISDSKPNVRPRSYHACRQRCRPSNPMFPTW